MIFTEQALSHHHNTSLSLSLSLFIMIIINTIKIMNCDDGRKIWIKIHHHLLYLNMDVNIDNTKQNIILLVWMNHIRWYHNKFTHFHHQNIKINDKEITHPLLYIQNTKICNCINHSFNIFINTREYIQWILIFCMSHLWPKLVPLVVGLLMCTLLFDWHILIWFDKQLIWVISVTCSKWDFI